MEIDHIQQEAEDGSDSIDNAIAVCFECHAEIHSYNDRHPRGRKFHPSELRRHKAQWLDICQSHAEVFRSAPRDTGVGPLQALIDELEFNVVIGKYTSHDQQGCLFLDGQFRGAIREGAIAALQDALKTVILEAYAAVGRANQHISAVMHHAPKSDGWAGATQRATDSIIKAVPRIEEARNRLLQFLRSE